MTSGILLTGLIEQAAAAATRLDGVPLAQVVTSPLERCRETAKVIAPGTRPVTDRRLLECDYGDWTGMELKALAKDKLWRTVQVQPSAAQRSVQSQGGGGV